MFYGFREVKNTENVRKKFDINTYKWYSLDNLKESEEKLEWLRYAMMHTLIGTDEHKKYVEQYTAIKAML